MALTSSQYRYFIAVSPGLEALLLSELGHVGLAGHLTPGGVECAGAVESLWAIHRYSRLAESVRVRLRPFEARSFAELEQNLERLPWHAYLRHGSPFTLSVTCQGSRLYHTEAIAERVRRVIHASWRASIPMASTAAMNTCSTQSECAAQRLHIRVHRDIVQVSVDASGERLRRRGYRTHVGCAPLRETLAAATVRLLLQNASARPVLSLWDPCCGSGTLLAEWLFVQLAQPACQNRAFAFEAWPIHDRHAYANWIEEQSKPCPSAPECRAFGSDNDPRSIAASHHNLARANLLDHCELFAQDFRAAVRKIPKNTAVVSNLPYGVRLTDKKDASRLFLKLDQLLNDRSDLRPVVVLNTLAPSETARCGWQQLASFANGGLRVTAWGLASSN